MTRCEKKKSLATLLAVVLVAAAGRADDAAADEVAAAIKAGMTADHVAVTGYYSGPVTRDEQIKSLAELKLTEYKSGKMKIKLLGKEGALVTYDLETKGTFKGKPLPRKNYASAVWVKQAGMWREAYYQETALEAK